MNCKEVKKLFALYLENEIPQMKRTEIENHLKTCPDCSHLLDEFSKFWGALEQRERIQPPANFWFRLQRRINDSEKEKSSVMDLLDGLIRFARPAAAIAVLLVGIFLGNYLGNISLTNDQTLFSDFQYLNVFSDLPTGSIEEIYFNITLEE